MKLLLFLIIFISACVSNERLPRVSAQEGAGFNCGDIQRELEVAEEFLLNIDSDPIEPSSGGEAMLLIPFLIAERLDVSDAEEHAEKRIKDLEVLQVKKGCSSP